MTRVLTFVALIGCAVAFAGLFAHSLATSGTCHIVCVCLKRPASTAYS